MLNELVMFLSESPAPTTTIDWSDTVTKAIQSVTADMTSIVTAGVPLAVGLVATIALAKFVIKWVKGIINRAG